MFVGLVFQRTFEIPPRNLPNTAFIAVCNILQALAQPGADSDADRLFQIFMVVRHANLSQTGASVVCRIKHG
jgi:hypothetical protein